MRRQDDGNAVSKDTTMAIWQNLATSTVLDTGTAMRCAKEIVKLLRPAAAPTVAQDAEDAPAPAMMSDEPGHMTTDESRGYLVKFMEQHFTDKTYHRYIRGNRESPLAGDFAWQMARALRKIAAAGSSQGQDGKDAARFVFEHTEPDAMYEIELAALNSATSCDLEWWRKQIDAALAAKEAGE